MSKIIGLLVAWGVEQWIEAAIKQALFLCDDVVISIGAHSKAMLKYEDGTLALTKKYVDRVRLVPTVFKGSHAQTKAATMNAMVKSSPLFKTGNWVWLLDADEFYHKSDALAIRSKLEEYNSAIVESRFFFIDTEHFLKSVHMRLWRITDAQCHFRPTNNWSGKRAPVWTVPLEMGMFHYSLLMNPYAKRDFWQSEHEGKSQRNKIKWLEEIYLKCDLKKQDYWLARNEKLFGRRSPFGISDFETNNGYLYEYHGNHPEWLDGIEKVPDFRKLYREI